MDQLVPHHVSCQLIVLCMYVRVCVCVCVCECVKLYGEVRESVRGRPVA